MWDLPDLGVNGQLRTPFTPKSGGITRQFLETFRSCSRNESDSLPTIQLLTDPHRLSQYSPQFFGGYPAWVAEIDLVVFAVLGVSVLREELAM